MTKVSLDYASTCDYDRTRALENGTVKPVGIDFNFMVLPTIEEVFWRTAIYRDFDSSEFSFSSYLVAKASSEGNRLPLVAIPVFPSRSFRHSAIYINVNAGIEKPEDLKGKTVGVPEYQMTAGTWARGILQHEYGVHPEDVKVWRTGGLEQGGRIEKLKLNLPAGVKVEPIPTDRTLNDMLEKHEIDALVTARMPSNFAKGSPNIRRLFVDYPAVEKEYYQKTGIFPIMHTVVIRQDVYEAHRWIARNLYDAFNEAKNIALEQAYEAGILRYSLPWMLHAVEEQREIFGENAWAYGVEPNLATIDALALYSHEQGLCERKISAEELFAPETLGGDSKI